VGCVGFCFWSVGDVSRSREEGEGDVEYLGIKTPGRHFMSSGPKGWEPRIYCSGSALDLLLQTWRSLFRDARGLGGLDSTTCSCSHRNSLMAESRVRVPRTTRGRNGEIL
jgi:hypothetical protein